MTPSVIWSNDPFGYSNSIPYIFNQAGLKRNVINRIHHGLKRQLQHNNVIPFLWTQYFDKKSEILTQVLPYTHYDILNSCGPDSNICCKFDFKRMTHWNCPDGSRPSEVTSANLKFLSNALVSELKMMSKMYEAPVMLMMHGDDFRYDMIEEWHQQLDNFLPIFDHINNHSEVEIRFGTFTDYFKELEGWYAQNKQKPYTLTGDFFPYMCAMGDYWTGYYTTRPFYKKQSRQTHNLIRTADLMSTAALARGGGVMHRDTIFQKLTKSRRAVALFQHHDAITGTSKNPVMENYSRLLHEAAKLASEVIEESASALYDGRQQLAMMEYEADFDKTLSLVPIKVTRDSSVRISVHNSLPHTRVDVISILSHSYQVKVLLEDATEIETQLEPALVQNTLSSDLFTISFEVRLSPLGSTRFSFVYEEAPKRMRVVELRTLENFEESFTKILPNIFKVSTVKEVSQLCLNNSQVQTVHAPSGMLEGVKTDKMDYPLDIHFEKYSSGGGGAYIMRNSAGPERINNSSSVLFILGEVRQAAILWIEDLQQTITIKNLPGDLGAQLHMRLHVDITKKINYELVMRVESAPAEPASSSFFVDSVGLQMLRREAFEGKPIAMSYYPMPSAAFVQDKLMRISVVSNVEHGIRRTSALGMEIMLDRRMMRDDGKGLGNAPDGIPSDMKPVEMDFTFITESRSEGAKTGDHFGYNSLLVHHALQSILYPLLLLYAEDKSLPFLPQPQALLALPCDVQLLSVRPLSANKTLLVLFRHGVDCAFESFTLCEDVDFGQSLSTLLLHFGVPMASFIQPTLLNGVTSLGTPVPPRPEELARLLPSPMKFLALTFPL